MIIAETYNVYLAMWAMLLAVYHHNQNAEQKIKTIACPGLGTATGRVPWEEAARQMAVAYQHFLEPLEYIDWWIADERQRRVGYGGYRGLSFT